jgi:hypothetical protein
VRRGVRIALWVAGGIVVLLGLAQIFLPKLAASRVSSRIGKYGKVDHVHVSAWPAIELLWGDADSIDVHASKLRVDPTQTAKLLDEARSVQRLDVTVAQAQEGPLPVSNVSLHKRGSRVSAQAYVSEADVAQALPPGFSVQLLGSDEGQVEVRASGGLFGLGASVDAVAQASEGKLVVRPRGALLEALKLTLFSDPRVYVEGVGATRSGAGYELSVTARLR